MLNKPKPKDPYAGLNIGAADTLMAIFGYRRVERCPYCDTAKVHKRLPCWIARRRKLVCPKQDGK